MLVNVYYIYNLTTNESLYWIMSPPYYNYITRIIKNIFNKNGRRCRDVKTQALCEIDVYTA